MAANYEHATGSDLTQIRQIVRSAFSDGGFRPLDSEKATEGFDGAYSGGGMVWIVQLLSTFAEFIRVWDPAAGMESKVVAAFTQIADSEQRWNLSLLVVIPQPLNEELIPAVSRFQEEPSSFARFVLPIETVDLEEELKHKISVVLMNWLNEKTISFLQDISVEDDIGSVIQVTAIEQGLGHLAALTAAVRSRDLNEDALVKALLHDLGKQDHNESK